MAAIKILMVSALVVFTGRLFAEDMSDSSFVFLACEDSSFWHTATGPTITLPIDYPDDATTATLAIRGMTYRADYDISGDSFVLSLPEAVDAESEDVYELTLTFDDGTVRTARIGLIAGLSDGAEGSTRCVFDMDSRKWPQAASHGVLPVPFEAESLTVDGVAVKDGDPGFTGAQGWYALPNLAVGAIVPVSMTAGDVVYDVSLKIWTKPGLVIIVK